MRDGRQREGPAPQPFGETFSKRESFFISSRGFLRKGLGGVTQLYRSATTHTKNRGRCRPAENCLTGPGKKLVIYLKRERRGLSSSLCKMVAPHCQDSWIEKRGSLSVCFTGNKKMFEMLKRTSGTCS